MKEGRKEERETKRYDYCVAEHRDHSNVTVVCSLSSSTFDILVAEAPMPKPADDPMANDPLLGRQLRAPDVDDPDVGTVLSVVLKKPAGKKKRTWHYTVEWRSPDGQVTLVREYERFEVAPFLISP